MLSTFKTYSVYIKSHLKTAVTYAAIYGLLFGIPSQVQAASLLTPKNGRPCLAASIPKSGTGLLRKLLSSLSYSLPPVTAYSGESFPRLEQGQFLLAHYTPAGSTLKMCQERGLKVILIIRDPRDVVVSMYYYFGKGYAKELGIPFEERDTIISNIIKYWYAAGTPAAQNSSNGRLAMLNNYDSYLNWQHYPGAMITTFEKLIGSRGGGNGHMQKNEILRIARFLEISLTDVEITHIQANLFGGTSTFREGKIGSWKDHFTKEHVALFKERGGDLLMRLGYETDNSWDVA